MTDEKLAKIYQLIGIEFKEASAKFNNFNSIHEGFAVLLEEVDELWDTVKERRPSAEKLTKEAKQVAAMAIRFLYDCCEV